MNFPALLGVALGGATGAVCRFLCGWISTHFWGNTCWGTFLINMTGCFLFGGLLYFFDHNESRPEWKIAVMTGFLGAFTTFSTYIADLIAHAGRHEWGTAVLSFAAHNIAGIAIFLFGYWSVAVFFKMILKT